jgi:hypothetical protein
VLQVGFVRPHLPADPTPNLARPPLISLDSSGASRASSEQALASWRDTYRAGLPRTAVWKQDPAGWARAHLGMIVQVLVFTIAAIVLLILRSHDLTAQLCVLALALSGVAGGGPLHGAENGWPLGLSHVLTVFAWLAGPLAFPIIALAILHFPSRSPELSRHP